MVDHDTCDSSTEINERHVNGKHKLVRFWSRTVKFCSSDVIADHNKMMNNFKKAMAKMAILGHDRKDLIDCSEVIPVPARFSLPPPHLPAGKTIGDIESSVSGLHIKGIGMNMIGLFSVLPQRSQVCQPTQVCTKDGAVD